ncbi:MAG: autotransporter outer membrane beta-barrel domain-containing protein [Neisseriaceae bacterium]|nr:autotransporter outer membrane beta-barrel domain-containing protein [Neisseriaceae bacterium]
MNKVYKVVKNARTGLLTVVSELASSHQSTQSTDRQPTVSVSSAKTRRTVLALSLCTLFIAPVQADTIVDLHSAYHPGQFTWGSDGKVNGINPDNANNFKKALEFGRDITTDPNKSYTLNFKPGNKAVDFQADNVLPFEEVDLQPLFDKGAAIIYDNSVPNGEDNPLNAPPTWEDWAFNEDYMVPLRWQLDDGEWVETEVFDATKIKFDNKFSFFAKVLKEQPSEPFHELTLARIHDGTLTLAPDEDPNWSLGQTKHSSLFIAQGNGANTATLNVTKPMTVTFSDAVSMNDALPGETVNFGQTQKLAGKIYIKELNGFVDPKTSIVYDGNFDIVDEAALIAYNSVLIAAIADNKLISNDYDNLIKKALIPTTAAEKIYTLKYQYTPSDDPEAYYISTAMATDTGMRSLIEAHGAKAVVNIMPDAKIRAIGSAELYAYNLYLHDQATAHHHATNAVTNLGTQNALVSDATFINEADGRLLFGYESADGSFPSNGSTARVHADQVQQPGGLYHNKGAIFVSAPRGDDDARNVALAIGLGALGQNDGQFTIAPNPTIRGEGVATGAHIQNNGRFHNTATGIMNIGLNNALEGGNTSDNLDVGNTYSAISTYYSDPNDAVHIINDGVINMGTNIQNAVAINTDPTPNTTNNGSFDHIKVENNHIINVDGRNTAGIKVVGQVGHNGEQIINSATGTINVKGKNATGLFAKSHAKVYNKGQIIVDGTSHVPTDAFSYGVRVDNAEAILTGAQSMVTIKGVNTIGVFARSGGQVKVADGAKVLFDAGTNQIGYWISGRNAQESSRISFDGQPVNLTVANEASTLFRVDQTASFLAGNDEYTFNITGKGATGFYVANVGTLLDTGGMTLNVDSENATGLTINSGAGADDKVLLNEHSKINVKGKDASVAIVDGRHYTLHGDPSTANPKAKLITKAALTSANVAQGAVAYKALEAGILRHEGSIDFTQSPDSVGIYVKGGVIDNDNDASVLVNGVGVDIHGANSRILNLGRITATDGTAAVRLNNGASLKLEGQEGAGLVKGEGSADGIRVHAGASLTADKAQIAISGSGSGIQFLNTDGDDGANKTFKLTGSGLITVSGNDGKGLTLQGEDASGAPIMANSHLDTSGATALLIKVEEAAGQGIVTHTSGWVKTGTSVDITQAQGQSALIVTGQSQLVEQYGNLTSQSDHAAVVDLTALDHDLTFTNQGRITAQTDQHIAIDAANIDKKMTFTNRLTGNIIGQTTLGGGNNQIALKDTSATGHLTAKNGDNVISLTEAATAQNITLGDGNNALTLNQTSQANDFKAGNGNNTLTLHGGTKINTATTGTSQMGNQYILNNVSEAQGGVLFNTLTAGAGAKDRLTLQGNSHYALTDPAKINEFEQLRIKANAKFEWRNTDIALNEQSVEDGVTVDANAELFVNSDDKGAFTFKHQLAGEGLVRTHTKGAAFDFDAASAQHSSQHFTGTLGLGTGTLDIANDNTRALTQAILRLDQEGIATVREVQGMGVQKMGGLMFNGGTLKFTENITGKKKLQSHIQVDHLNLVQADGTVEATAAGFDNLPTPNVDFNLPLLEQDEGDAIVQLVAATTVSGIADPLTLTLRDAQGQAITTTPTQQAIRQNGQTVATASYDYGFQTTALRGGADDGLYVAYKLTEIDLQGTGQNALVLAAAAGQQGSASRLDAKLTGSGDVAINSDSDWVGLANWRNDYSGQTLVQRGKLRLEADTVLGNTSLLDLTSGTEVNFNSSQNQGTTQTIGQLKSQAGSELALADGTLTIKQGGTADGRLSGSLKSTLVAENGSLKVNGANAPLAAHIDIKAPASIDLNNAQGLGSGLITNAGKLNLNQAQGVLRNDIEDQGQVNLKGASIDLAGNNQNFAGSFNIDGSSTLQAAVQNHIGSSVVNNSGTFIVNQADTAQAWQLDNEVKGTGTLVKANAGTLQLTDRSAQYTGATDIQGGTLLAGTEAQALSLNSKRVNVGKGTQFAGFGEAKGDVDNQGTFLVGGLNKTEQNNATQYRVAGNFNNNGGAIKLGSKQGTGSRLTVGGNFVANGGRIDMNTVLNKGHEETETDQLVVGGNVSVGANGPTTLYITPVGGKGADTRKQPDAIKVVDVGGTSANSAFKLGAPVAIGIYEYLLHKGHTDDSWYLDSYDTNVYPPEENIKPPVRNPNPIIGAYLANQSSALSMFSMTLHDRLGEPQYADSLKGDDGAASVWLRVVAERQKHQAADGLLSLKGNTYTTQIGGDIIKWQDEGQSRGRIGLMAAYGKSDYTSRSNTTGSEAKAKIKNAYSLGIYGTWYQNEAQPKGAYVDLWAQYSWFKNEVSMGRSPAAKYDSTLFSASIEGGYTFKLHQQDEFKQWTLQPQAQITLNAFDSDESVHASGLKADGDDASNVLTRLGARLTYANRYEVDKSVQPFAEINWLHSTARNSMAFNDQYTFKDDIPSNRFELKVGAEGQLSKNWSVWGNVAHQTGKASYSAYRAMVGAKYQWQ